MVEAEAPAVCVPSVWSSNVAIAASLDGLNQEMDDGVKLTPTDSLRRSVFIAAVVFFSCIPIGRSHPHSAQLDLAIHATFGLGRQSVFIVSLQVKISRWGGEGQTAIVVVVRCQGRPHTNSQHSHAQILHEIAVFE